MDYDMVSRNRKFVKHGEYLDILSIIIFFCNIAFVMYSYLIFAKLFEVEKI